MIDNVLRQTFKNFELLIVDNGSEDGSKEIAIQAAAMNKNIAFFQQETKGLAFARNTGIRQATGGWILLLDSDNYFQSNSTLENLHRLLSEFKTNCVMCGTTSDTGKLISEAPFPIVNDKALTFRQYLNCRGEFSPVVRTDWFKEHLYPERIGAITEFPWMVWCQAAEENTLSLCTENTLVYGTSANGKICSDVVSQRRAWELSLYYKMILDRFGQKFLFNSPKLTAVIGLKLTLYSLGSIDFQTSKSGKYQFFKSIIGKSIRRLLSSYKKT